MTGMDVLLRCRNYGKEVERMRVKRACVRDAQLRLTRPTDAQGRGSGGDKMAEMTARIDALERGIDARKSAYEMEVVEALRLIGEVENAEMGAVLYAHYVSGDSYAAISVGRKMSMDSVRSYKKRGAALMEEVSSALSTRAEYIRMREEENRALRPAKDPTWP